MTQLSQNFSLEELTFSQAALRRGIDNTPSVPDVDNLRRLCVTLLEPARHLLGVPLHVDSGYRSPQLNQVIGGAASSAHLEGRAADVIPIGMPLAQAFSIIRSSDLPFDRVIFECNAWLHLQIADEGQPIRHLAELASGGPGNWSYTYA